MAQFIVLGSWKIRHDEYPSEAEKTLYFLSLPEEYNLSHRTVLCDVSAIESPILDSDFAPVSDQVEKANLSERTVPLALVSLDGSAATVTHLVHRVEVFTTQFYQQPALPLDVNKGTLFDALSSLFKEHYLLSNNFECYYEKGIAAILLFAALSRFSTRISNRLQAFITRHSRSYLFIMGAVHGLSNMGGSLLSAYAVSKHNYKKEVLSWIVTGYLLFGLVQLSTLSVLNVLEVSATTAISCGVAAVTYLSIGNRIFKSMNEHFFQHVFSVFMLVYAGLMIIS
ncbi:hypothetical protein ACFFUP_11510 [Vibrio ostreicida]|uniref:Uncharacterized protein n=1 Tax=Vibrio ostreicida TaxID=526588 RepID=A0ABT8BSW8_9VIBR|nr:hypothetical protein [Vibrio ostreicida]MDN3609759.1 hypothetical protein [Vibrio ostreicida]NPD09411.1 hypothetical protein [Vibrio ostreicida]